MQFPPVLTLYKPIGATPLETIRAYQQQHPAYQTVKLGYAGRLDPMAEGLLLVLVGEENKKRKAYEQLPKTYVFDILFGIATDSYDLLGMITESETPPSREELKTLIPSIQKQFTGTIQQAYPPYSSKPVNGKPLFWWARENRLSEITIPEKEVTISSLELLSTTEITATEVESVVKERINRVRGVFRQKEILAEWETYFKEASVSLFPVMRFQATVSSGTYIRSLVHHIGQHVGVPTTTLNLIRTNVGNYHVETQCIASLHQPHHQFLTMYAGRQP